MVLTYDVGSLPFTNDHVKFFSGAKVPYLTELLHLKKYDNSKKYFENYIKQSFFDKIKTGLDIPNFPQFRDMNEMFLSSIKGIKKTRKGYVLNEPPFISRDRLVIPELAVIKNNSKEISEKASKTVNIKICITGPYTLSSLFQNRRHDIFFLLSNVLSQIIENNIIKNKYARTLLVAVDEPVFGFSDDPLIDYGSQGRENLLKAWEYVFHTIKSKKVRSCIHLHNTSNELFWEIQSLDIVESHVDDPLYTSPTTLTLLEKRDKFLKASIAVTAFDSLIGNWILTKKKISEASLNLQIAQTWTAIRNEKLSPLTFLEPVEDMVKRLNQTIVRFGENRIPFAGPECGLKSFPTYSSALECLRRVALAVKQANI